MKTLFFTFVVLTILSATLTACSQDSEALDSLRVSGDMTTVFRAGSNGHFQQNRVRTGIEF